VCTCVEQAKVPAQPMDVKAPPMPEGPMKDGQCRAKFSVTQGRFSLAVFAATNPGELSDFYQTSKVVGEGGFGSVRKATCKATGATRAVKSIARDAVPDVQVLREEIDIMRLLDHPNIVRLHEAFEDKCWVYLVMDLCEGGELFHIIAEATSQHISESEACFCAEQMFLAVNYLHQNLIMHRDLKPENFLLATKGPLHEVTLKLIDFGFAKRFSPGRHSETCCGTLFYAAPEVLNERYDHKVDVWSLGVVIYLMLVGEVPWGWETDEKKLKKLVRTHKIATDSKPWSRISQDAKSFVLLLLLRDAKQRPLAVQALQHSWLQTKNNDKSRNSMTRQDMTNLKAFGRMSKLKKAAVEVVVSQLPGGEIRHLSELFLSMDTNKDGTVSAAELKAGLETAGASFTKDLDKLFAECDQDGSGALDYMEFVAATVAKKTYHQKDVVWAAFRAFDKDGSGYIDKDAIAKILHEDASVKAALHVEDASSAFDEIFARVDKNNDNRIDFDEFFAMMQACERDPRWTSKGSPSRSPKGSARDSPAGTSPRGRESSRAKRPKKLRTKCLKS